MEAPAPQVDFSKVDWNQYQSWEKVTTDSGGVVYVVPGTGWVYDPFTSAQTGRVQLFKNPKPSQDAKKKEQDAIKKATSPAMQAIPVVTGVGAAVAAPWLLDKAMGAKAIGTIKLPSGKVGVTWNDGTIKTPDGLPVNAEGLPISPGAAPDISGAMTPANTVSPTGEAFSQGAATVANPVQIGVNADGSPIYQTLSPSDVSGTAPTGTNWGAIGQGVGGALQLYGAGQQWKAGDKIGAGLSGAAGAANIGAASGLESVAPWAAPLTAGAGLWGTWKGMEASNSTASAFGGAQLGAGAAGTAALLGAPLGPLGMLAGAGIGAIGGALLGHIGGAKSQVQQQRDDIRKGFQALNIADKDHNVTLADGSTYNIGLDGHAMLANQGANLDGKTERHPYDVDFSNPWAVAAVPTIKTLAMQMLGEKASQKQIDDTTGMLVNAVTSNAKSQDDVNANIAAIQARAGRQAQQAQQPQAPQSTPPQITPPTSQNPQIGNQGPVLNDKKPPSGPGKNTNINGSQMTNQQLGRSLAKRINQRVG